MQGMNTGGGKTPLAEKVFRWLPVAGIAALVFYFWGLVSSFVLRTIADNSTESGRSKNRRVEIKLTRSSN